MRGNETMTNYLNVSLFIQIQTNMFILYVLYLGLCDWERWRECNDVSFKHAEGERDNHHVCLEFAGLAVDHHLK